MGTGKGENKMSILIHMEMPTRCLDCPFMLSRDNDDCILQSAESNESFENWEQMKAGCPLIDLPPHGRLGDLDALMAEFEQMQTLLERRGHEFACSFMSSSMEISTEWYCVEDVVNAAPTIIPADKEDT